MESVLTSKGGKQIQGSLCRRDVADLTFSSISIIVLYPAPLYQILQSLFLVQPGLQDESCLKTESTMIYCLYIFNSSHNDFSTGLSSVICGLSMFSGMSKLNLNDLNYQYSMHMNHQ